MSKTFSNTDINKAHDQVKDIKTFGNGDMFKLLSKAWSEDEGWMKSSKAMEIPFVGCVVQVTTQQGDNVAEAVTFVPGTRIIEEKDKQGSITGRHLEMIDVNAAMKKAKELMEDSERW